MTEPIKGFFGEYRFLSNFYSAPFLFDGILWPTSEHAYQAHKTEDRLLREYVSRMTHAKEAKNFGSELQRKGEVRPNFHVMKIWVMQTLVLSKFVQNRDLAEKLLATGSAVLVESNTWHDNFWGNCTCADCTDRTGNNVLGRILMEVRSQLAVSESRKMVE